MELNLKDKVALVTGTGSQLGMGKATALYLAKEGCHIIATDVDLAGAQKTAQEVKALGRKAIALKADVGNKDEVAEMVNAALKEFGKIDILVNAAGLTAGSGPFLKTKEENWKKDIDVNLFGVMNVSKSVLPGMVERKYGKIVNIASTAGRSGGGSYAAAKAAAIAITKGLANEFGGSGINVNAVAPTSIPYTNFGPSQQVLADPVRMKALADRSPQKRPTTVEEVVYTIAFLASDVSSGIIGDTISIGSIGL